MLKTILAQKFKNKKTTNKKLSKYVTAFDYFDKAVIVYLQQVKEHLLFLLQVLLELLQE